MQCRRSEQTGNGLPPPSSFMYTYCFCRSKRNVQTWVYSGGQRSIPVCGVAYDWALPAIYWKSTRILSKRWPFPFFWNLTRVRKPRKTSLSQWPFLVATLEPQTSAFNIVKTSSCNISTVEGLDSRPTVRCNVSLQVCIRVQIEHFRPTFVIERKLVLSHRLAVSLWVSPLSAFERISEATWAASGIQADKISTYSVQEISSSCLLQAFGRIYRWMSWSFRNKTI